MAANRHNLLISGLSGSSNDPAISADCEICQVLGNLLESCDDRYWGAEPSRAIQRLPNQLGNANSLGQGVLIEPGRFHRATRPFASCDRAQSNYHLDLHKPLHMLRMLQN